MNSPREHGKHRRERPRVRLLFDENLPWRVAGALRQLGYRASYVGHESDGAPMRGSSDRVILDHARASNQVVVTSNHDMILLCLEEGRSVIWLDPRGRHITWEEMVVLVFRAAREWDRMLARATEPVCIRTLHTKNETLPAERAIHLAQQRMRRIAARERRKPKPRPLGPLLEAPAD